jgi:hypothetical protein
LVFIMLRHAKRMYAAMVVVLAAGLLALAGDVGAPRSAALASSTASAPEVKRNGACGETGARYDVGYPAPDSADTDGHCEGDFANYEGASKWAIANINATMPRCEELRMFLLYDATIFEWTGWAEDEYWMDAGTWEERVGFHWPWVDSTWLWSHQGALGVGASVVEATALADMCTSLW